MKKIIENLLCRLFHTIQKQNIPGRGVKLFCKECERRVKG